MWPNKLAGIRALLIYKNRLSRKANGAYLLIEKKRICRSLFPSCNEYMISITQRGGALKMRDHDRDSPIDAEIQRLIEKREFTEAFEQSYIAFKGEIKTRCIRALRSYVDDPVAEGEDLAQKIFTEFFRLLPTHYQPNLAKVRTFLNHITRRRIQDRLKQIKSDFSVS